jgi:hypothetical protein
MAIAQAIQARPSLAYRRLMEQLPVRTPQRTIVPLRFNPAQEKLWQLVAPLIDTREPIKLLVLKARREGVSTWTEALLTAACVLQDYTQALVVAHLAVPTKRIWAMSQRFVMGSPLQAIATFKGQTIGFRHSVLELATAGTPEAARSADLTCFHGSEVAFWKDAGAMLAIRQCLPQEDGGFYIDIEESTANGMVEDGELFYQEWQAAMSGLNGFTPVFLPWHTFPQYTSRLERPLDDVDDEETLLRRDLHLTWGQLRWRRQMIADRCQGDVDKFNQEYPATPEMAFIMSGLPFFRPGELLWLEPHIEPGVRGRLRIEGRKIVFHREAQGRLTIFRPPAPGHQYVIGADSSMGLTETDKRSPSRSAAEVLDMDTLEQVAEYDAAAPPHLFARDLALLGRLYHNALLAPEVQASGGGGGREVVVYLRDEWGYYNLHRWSQPDRIVPGQATLYGWETTSRTRPRMIARIREVVTEQSARIHSRLLLTQLRNFGESESNRLEALAGHDDALFAWGIALMSRSEHYVARSTLTAPAQEMRVDVAALGYATQPAWETEETVWQDMVKATPREASGDWLSQ